MDCKYIKQGIRINEDGTVVPCCEFTGDVGITYSSLFTLDGYLGSQNLTTLRSHLMNDEWPYGCKNCANNEAQKHLSLRQRGQVEISDRITLDLVIGNECNSDCVMCYAGQSSKINSRLRNDAPNFKVPDIDQYWIRESGIARNWANDSNFWNLIDENLDRIESIKFLGGEPLLSKKLWEWLGSASVDKHKKDTKLTIITNASIIDDRKMHLLEGWKKTMITISIDAIEREYEWIRHGLDWKTVNENVKRFQRLDGAVVTIHSTLSIYNVAVIDRLLQWAEDNDLLFSISPVVSPSLLSIRYAPIDILRKTSMKLSEMHPTKIQSKMQMIGLKNIIDSAINDNVEDARLRKQMTDYFNSHRDHSMDWETLQCKI